MYIDLRNIVYGTNVSLSNSVGNTVGSSSLVLLTPNTQVNQSTITISNASSNVATLTVNPSGYEGSLIWKNPADLIFCNPTNGVTASPVIQVQTKNWL